jgi:septum formation protein
MTEPIGIVLASASPRRRDLLERAGVRFEVRPTDVDESLAGAPAPLEAALELAARKARAGADAMEDRAALVVGSDTVVGVRAGEGWRLLGKPADRGEAAAMLELLSGTTHAVVTGVAVVAVPGGTELRAAETTWVTMRRLTAAEVAAYVESGEWEDKAGGYAIQETADRFVTELSGGGFDNVVGLPVARTLRMLDAVAAVEERPWR